MISSRSLLKWIVGYLALTCLVRAEVLDTWIIAGQSNAEGYGITESPVSGLLPASTLSTIGRSDLNATHTNIQMFQGANEYSGITASAGLSLPAKNTWHSMNAQEGLAYDWGAGRGQESGRRFGPELAFGFDVQAQIGTRIALIKYARGSASIASSATQSGSIWLDYDPSDGGRLNHYDKLITTIQTAVDNLPAGQVLNVRGVIWMQGEGDATATFASAYQTNLTEFITTLRTDIGTIATASGGKMTRSANTWSELDVFLGTIQNSGANHQTVINAQNAVAAADVNVHTVNATTGLSLMSFDDWGASGVHYDTAGQVMLGERFADAALAEALPGYRADPFGNGTIKTPTTASGGTGTASNVQADDDVNYTVAKAATANIGGFGTHAGAISSVHLFVQYTTETGYTGTNAIQVNGVNTTIVPAARDYGRWAYVEITAGSFGIDTSAELSTMSVTFNNNHSGTGKSVLLDCVYVVVNPQTPIPAQPTWCEDFNGSGGPNPMIWTFEQGFARNEELQWYQSNNAWQESGNLIIEGRSEQVLNPNYNSASTDWRLNRQYAAYTSSSIVTTNKFYWKYGRAQIRAKIPAKPGMWPAIWGTGEVGNWPHNGEVDILEYYGEKILANCAVGTTAAWNAKWDSLNRSMASLLVVEPNWRNEWHIWTMQWDDQNVRLYVDNVLVNTIPQTWLVNTAGYNTAWGPQYPFISNGMSCWLNLAMGGAGGDPTTTMNSGPQRYLIDYWKIWEGATSNVAPTNITLTSNGVTEGQAIGTVVGNLSATDADPAEVHRFTLIAGTGDTHNSQFTIPEFVSNSTTQGVIKTAAVLNYAEGATRSIRVRVTDIEGATYDKILTVNVLGIPVIEVNPSSVTVAEGGTQTFQVRLNTLPASNTTINVARQSGDSNISISSGSSLLFTPTNGTSWQTVTLAAAEDVDKIHGVATILCSDPGSIFASATLTATEIDNDNSVPAVNAGVDDTVFLTGSKPWTPAELSLAAWYDASDTSTITTSPGTVTQWRDKTSANNHMTASGNPTSGSHQINNLNAIDFSSDYFTMTSAINMLGKSAFLSVESDSFAANQILIGKSGVNLQLRIDTSGAIRYAALNPYYLTTSVSTGLVSVGQPSIIGYLLDSNMKYSVDGVEEPGVGNDGAGDTTFDIIGCRSGPTNYFDGRIGEIVITNALPSTNDRQKIEGYLAHKWGTTNKLPSSPAHPYKTVVPSLTTAVANLDGTVSDPDGQTLTTTWTKFSGPGTVVFGNANVVDTTASFTSAGTYVLRLSAYDGTDTTIDEVTIVVSAPNAYSSWAAESFANPFITTGYTRNPDGDSLNNLQEFAFGMDPTSASGRSMSFVEGGALTSPGTPIYLKDGSTNLAVFTRRKDHVAAGLTYSVWFSADLSTWTQSGDTPTRRTSASDPGNYEAVSVPYPNSVPAPKFFKVGVVSSP